MNAFCSSMPLTRHRTKPALITRKTPYSTTRTIGTKRPHSARVPQCIEVTNQTAPTISTFSVESSAIREGIKAIAVGKNGVKPVPSTLNPLILAELILAEQQTFMSNTMNIHNLLLLRASFMGCLFVKAQLSPSETDLLSLCSNPRTARHVGGVPRITNGFTISPGELLEYIAPGQTGPLYPFAMRALSGDRFCVEDATRLGKLLYAPSERAVQPVKVLLAHVMRVRHEEASELAGLAIAAAASVDGSFFSAEATAPNYETLLQGGGKGYVHIAEPFDGTVTWDLLTPLLGRYLKNRYGLRVVMGVGDSAGPKYGPNLQDIVKRLGIPICDSADEIKRKVEEGEFGVAVSQDVSAGLMEWVGMRRVILKRPSIATTEKYVDCCPGGASLFIASAFHGGYVEKMAIAAENVGFPAYIIVGGGMEGSTGIGARKARLLMGWREGDRYVQREFGYNMESEGGIDGMLEITELDAPKLRSLRLEDCIGRIERFVDGGSSGDRFFDERVFATCRAFDAAFDVLKVQRAPLFDDL